MYTVGYCIVLDIVYCQLARYCILWDIVYCEILYTVRYCILWDIVYCQILYTLAEPAVTPEAGPETADGGITSNKRSVGNTSFDQSPRTSNSQNAKRPFTDLLSTLGAIPDSTTITHGMLIASLESMFQRFETIMNARFDSLDSRLDLLDTVLVLPRKVGRLEILLSTT